VSIDLFILGAVLLAGILGAMAGASRQIANVAALFVAYGCAKPLGTFFGPRVAHSIHQSNGVAIVAATIFFFLVVLIAVRHLITRILRKFLSGTEDEDRGPDRALGFFLGATKVLLIAWVMVSGLVFVEQHVSLAGRKLGIAPKDSIAFQLAHRFNLFELTQFSSVDDLSRLAQELQKPGAAQRLQKRPAYRDLLKDPRFQKVFADKSLRHALASGDSLSLLHNDAVLSLIQDPQTREKLTAALAPP
jgi:membrane protein required for colicin V production